MATQFEARQIKVRPLSKDILVINMDMGEMKSAGGIIIQSDDGKDRGIHPRWAKVFAVGPEHNEEYKVGDWILIEHGRWTRGIKYETESGEEITIRMIDNDAVMLWSNEEPKDFIIGNL